MWDVKTEHVLQLLSLLADAFYLNYVGCKGIFMYECCNMLIEFYLNYVGCKVEYSNIFGLCFYSFI